MAWTFVIRSGELLRGGVCHGSGYSGFGDGRNNPDLQAVHNVGPIPCGVWGIEGPPHDSQTHGPFCLRLVPHDGTETYGRTGLLIHGDSKAHPGAASQGCVIMPRAVRERVWASGDRILQVIADEPRAVAAEVA